MNTEKDINQLTSLLMRSVSPFHCVLAASRFLEQKGFTRLDLTDAWDLKPEQGYYLPSPQGKTASVKQPPAARLYLRPLSPPCAWKLPTRTGPV